MFLMLCFQYTQLIHFEPTTVSPQEPLCSRPVSSRWFRDLRKQGEDSRTDSRGFTRLGICRVALPPECPGLLYLPRIPPVTFQDPSQTFHTTSPGAPHVMVKQVHRFYLPLPLKIHRAANDTARLTQSVTLPLDSSFIGGQSQMRSTHVILLHAWGK